MGERFEPPPPPEAKMPVPEPADTLPQPDYTPETAERDKKEEFYKGKLAEVKRNTAKNKAAILELAQMAVDGVPVPEEVETMSPDTLLSEAARITEQETLSREDFIYGAQMATQLDRLSLPLAQQQSELLRQRMPLQNKVRRLREDLAIYDSTSPVGRALFIVPRIRLSQQIKHLEREISALKEQEEQLSRPVTEYAGMRRRIRGKQEDCFRSVITPEHQRIKEGYVDLLDTILEEGDLPKEIKEAYIDEEVVPLAKKLTQTTKLTEGAAEEYLTHLREVCRGRIESGEHTYRVPQVVIDASEGFYTSVSQRLEPLFDDSIDREIIEGLTSEMYRQDIAQVTAEVSDVFGFDSWRARKIEPTSDDDTLTVHFDPVTTYEIDREKVSKFNAVKKSNIARVVFGAEIDETDRKIYFTAVTKAVNDRGGEYVQTLRYYPTPEVIRNLVILAAAEGTEYSRSHANNTLTLLAKREDWEELLDQAIEDIPALENARDLLQNWEAYSNYLVSGIRKAGSEVAKSIIVSDADSRLGELAVEALPNDELITLLLGESILDQDAVGRVQRGITFLERKADVARLTRTERHTLTDQAPIQASPEDWENQMQEALRYNDCLENFNAQVRKTVLGINSLTSTIRGLESDPGRYEQQNRDELEKQRAALHAKFHVYGEIVSAWERYLDDPDRMSYLISQGFLELVEVSTADSIQTVIQAYEYCPVIVETAPRNWFVRNLITQYPEKFLNEKGLRSLQTISDSYDRNQETAFQFMIGLVAVDKLDQDRAIALPGVAADLLREYEDLRRFEKYPQLFLETDEGLQLYRALTKLYPIDTLMNIISEEISAENITTEQALSFPENAPLLMDEDRAGIRNYVIKNAELTMRSADEVVFINGLVGRYGKSGEQLIKDYVECLKAGCVEPEDRALVLEFTQQFRVLSPELFNGYKEAHKTGTKEVYLSGLRSLAEKMVSPNAVTPEERKLPYYEDLIRASYPNNSSSWTSYENNLTCEDRSQDLEVFEIRPRYVIDLLSAATIDVTEGETLDQETIHRLKNNILSLAEEMSTYEYDLERSQELLNEEVDSALTAVRESGGLAGIDFSEIHTIEEKLFLLMANRTYETEGADIDLLKDLIIKYEFAYFEDIRQYIQGTSDRLSQANNQDYALLCELHTFYSDRIKEVHRSLVKSGWDNPAIAARMPHYFEQLSRVLVESRQKDTMDRLRIDRLGMSDSFIRQISRILKKRTGRDYTPEQVHRMISLYESVTGGLQDNTTESPKKWTRAFYGQLRSQRNRSLQAVEEITGEVVDPTDIHLGNIDLQELVSQHTQLETGQYDSEQFANYTTQRFLDTFSEERNSLENELNKFESTTGNKREVVNGYFIKTKESANARMVGGVCVSGDNPGKVGENCQWNSENYFQLVLQDPDTLRCQGVILLHHFTDSEGRKVMAASLNPSSTYLYSVDETALFEGIMGTLEQFATINDFDMILTSQNKTIRTNRTGGEFERAIDSRVSQVGETYTFDQPEVFSYVPKYDIQEMDVVWKRGS